MGSLRLDMCLGYLWEYWAHLRELIKKGYLWKKAYLREDICESAGYLQECLGVLVSLKDICKSVWVY